VSRDTRPEFFRRAWRQGPPPVRAEEPSPRNGCRLCRAPCCRLEVVITPAEAASKQLATIDGEIYPGTLLGRWMERSQGRDDALREDIAMRLAVDLLVEQAKPIPVEQAQAREKLWTPEKEGAERSEQIWTPGS